MLVVNVYQWRCEPFDDKVCSHDGFLLSPDQSLLVEFVFFGLPRAFVLLPGGTLSVNWEYVTYV